ncbi:MAG TPA: hypothetical protein DCX19_05535, partial [Alphaproteobacteria bacterium]|nr:hypothetical protein [Alphaproteobacteria bacterium]
FAERTHRKRRHRARHRPPVRRRNKGHVQTHGRSSRLFRPA